MGVLCQSCNSFKLDLDPQNNNDNNKQQKLIFPKQYVNIENEEKEIYKKKENNNKKEIKQKNKIISSSVINIIKKKEEKEIEENTEYLKSKSLDSMGLSTKKCQSTKTISGRKKKIRNDEYSFRINKRSNSLPNNKKYEDNFNNHFSKSKESKVIQNYKRNERKSTTLLENSKILNQLFLVQMSIPVSQELLVTQQKGNPFDKYIRGKKIGKGTFGVVYMAKSTIFKNIVAMKVIKKRENMNNVLIKNEIDILKKLSHPNIVRIYEFYESKNNFYLINEYCSGGELYNYINHSKLNEQQLSVLFYQVFSGLCYLHENNILHRDMKPENILISKKEIDLLTEEEYFWIQIIDFGTAKIFEQNKTENSIVGSFYYIAPEVLEKDYNEKCDTWSVGVILYMFLVGRPPFDGKSGEEIINSIKTKNFDESNQNFVKRSPEVKDLVKGLLIKDKNKRLSAKEALNHKWFKKFNGRKLFGNFMSKDIEPYIDNLFNYTFHSKIQQLVIAFLVHNLPTTESSRNILKIYRYFNESGNCKLTKEELINGLNKYRKKEEVVEKVDNLFILLDSDNNGYIEYEEFLRACIDKKEVLTNEYLKYAFKFLDKDRKGTLNCEEINKAFLKKENKLFEIAINKDINDVDHDGDGIINFAEFKQLMTNSIL